MARSPATRSSAVALGIGVAAALFWHGEARGVPEGGPGAAGAREGRILLHAEAPPLGHTGGFGEPTCVICHIGDDENAYGGSVSILGLPEAYEPGAKYALTVVLRAEETTVAGFQLSARFSEGETAGGSAGELAPVSPRVEVKAGENGVVYAHQNVAGSPAQRPDGSIWLVEWTAPESDDPVVFHVAANSGNGDNSPLSDLVYRAEVRVQGGRRRSRTITGGRRRCPGLLR